MKIAKYITCGMAAALVMVGTVNADISYALSSSAAIFINPWPNGLPADSWYQTWWSADAITIETINGGDVQASTAAFTTLGGIDPASVNGSGDYLVGQGGTPGTFGFVPTKVAGIATDALVGGNDVDAGFMYAIVYYDTIVPKGSTTGLATPPPIGASALFSETKMTADMLPFTGTPPPPNDPAQGLDFGGSPTIDDGTHGEVIADVVPEPGTMALFALGIATIAWRRRKK